MLTDAFRFLQSLTNEGILVFVLGILAVIYVVWFFIVRLLNLSTARGARTLRLFPSADAHFSLVAVKQYLWEGAKKLWARHLEHSPVVKLTKGGAYILGAVSTVIAVALTALNLVMMGQIMELFFRSGRTVPTPVGRMDTGSLVAAGVFILAEGAAGIILFVLNPQLFEHLDETLSPAAHARSDRLKPSTRLGFSLVLVVVLAAAVGFEVYGAFLRGYIQSLDVRAASVAALIGFFVPIINIIVTSYGYHLFLESLFKSLIFLFGATCTYLVGLLARGLVPLDISKDAWILAHKAVGTIEDVHKVLADVQAVTAEAQPNGDVV